MLAPLKKNIFLIHLQKKILTVTNFFVDYKKKCGPPNNNKNLEPLPKKTNCGPEKI